MKDLDTLSKCQKDAGLENIASRLVNTGAASKYTVKFLVEIISKCLFIKYADFMVFFAHISKTLK